MNIQTSDKNGLQKKISLKQQPLPIKKLLPRLPEKRDNAIPSILVLTTYPPTECGIATYSQDLVGILQSLFSKAFNIQVCAIGNLKQSATVKENKSFCLDAEDPSSYAALAKEINEDSNLSMLLVQHEFGLFHQHPKAFLDLLRTVQKPKVIVFHTVLPQPNADFKEHVQDLIKEVKHVIVMTQASKEVLVREYQCNPKKVAVIPHGTHLIAHKNKEELKTAYGFQGKTILSTFGLLGPGKSIETSLEALSTLVSTYPDLLFLIIGKTHPEIVKHKGETYREQLHDRIQTLGLQEHVHFINEFVALDNLLEYLQLTDIYLFTSNDPNQAVSGTFSYAMSCGCPIISTPIPHAVEFLDQGKGLLFDFGNAKALAKQIKKLLDNAERRTAFGLNSLHASVANTWENSAIAHAKLFQALDTSIRLTYNHPKISFQHLKKMTTPVGIIQFSNLNHPDLNSGYTLDDNARALIVICKAYAQSADALLLPLLSTYCNFILNCQLHNGKFMNYVDRDTVFTEQNNEVNLDDSNGRAVWALGQIIAIKEYLPKAYEHLAEKATDGLEAYMPHVSTIHSPRAIGFLIKGIALSKTVLSPRNYKQAIAHLADKLAAMYAHENDAQWNWFEDYLTYGNAILPEAMLIAFEVTGNTKYETIAKQSFRFLLKHVFQGNTFRAISNKTWFRRGEDRTNLQPEGQQAIDVAYTILALSRFNKLYPGQGYATYIKIAFSWFLGENHLQQTVYNPCTKGCYDGLEATNVNLNQGAESLLSYLLSRLTVEELENHA